MTRLKIAICGVIGAAAIISAPVNARLKTTAPDSKALDPILACQATAPDFVRLACYDSAVRALQAAAARKDVVVIDQQDVARARRALFGFSLPSFDFLGAGKNDDAHDVTPEESLLTATIRAVTHDGDGNWIFTLDGGAVWHQTTGSLAASPKIGETVEIRRAALGSYFMRVGRQPGFKAKRDS